MDFCEARELAVALRRQRLRIVYFAHRYAAWLLARAAGEGVPMRELKRWCQGWYQTTRPGSNLIVLLNFSLKHNAVYRRCLDPGHDLPMVVRGHPHARPPEITLAWTRVDVDRDRGEALIEEVQTDWIREFASLWSCTERVRSRAARDRLVREEFRNRAASFEGLARYWTRVLALHRSWWADATLFATLWLLVEKLRIRRVYYHTFEGGERRKGLAWSPPRSLYTGLPERFGFESTCEPPRFLVPEQPSAEAARRAARGEPPWYRLAF